MNPEYSSNAFYDALIKVPDWQNADIAHAAQEVQRSADGTAYAQHEGKARVTASVPPWVMRTLKSTSFRSSMQD